MGAAATRLALVPKPQELPQRAKRARLSNPPTESEDAQMIIIGEAHYLFDSVKKRERHEPILSANDVFNHIHANVESIMHTRCRREVWNLRIDFMVNSLRKTGSGFCIGNDAIWRMEGPAPSTQLPRFGRRK